MDSLSSVSSDICGCACGTRVDWHRTVSLGLAHSSKLSALCRVASLIHSPFSGLKTQHTHNLLQIVLLRQPFTLLDHISSQLVIEWASNSDAYYIYKHSRQSDVLHTDNWLDLRITHKQHSPLNHHKIYNSFIPSIKLKRVQLIKLIGLMSFKKLEWMKWLRKAS